MIEKTKFRTMIPCPRCECEEAVIDKDVSWGWFSAVVQCETCGLGRHTTFSRHEWAQGDLIRRLNADYLEWEREHQPHDFSVKITGKP
jgi:transcription elongation factor Elf1